MGSQINRLQAIKYRRGELQILDQLLLPHQTSYYKIETVQEGHHAIKSMMVRGAPAIAIVAALSLAVELNNNLHKLDTKEILVQFIFNSLEYLKTSRPTAVNLFDAAGKLWKIIENKSSATDSAKEIVTAFLEASENMLDLDVQDNTNIGNYGSTWFKNSSSKKNLRILTHCNTGSLATAGYGTALGIIRSLQAAGCLEHAYCTETRPYNQGSRLTAYELVYEKIPSTLICDSMVTALLAQGRVDGIVVGADRVAENGDTANKIGTYQLAVLASHFNVPFIVAAPTTSIDLNTLSGKQIPIEERSGNEVTTATGLASGSTELITISVAHSSIPVWNPAFDVTPASLITAIVTERGVFTKRDSGSFELKKALSI